MVLPVKFFSLLYNLALIKNNCTHSHNNRHSTQMHFLMGVCMSVIDAKPLPVTLMVLPVKVMFLSMRAL